MESNSFKHTATTFKYTNWYFILPPGPRGLARPPHIEMALPYIYIYTSIAKNISLSYSSYIHINFIIPLLYIYIYHYYTILSSALSQNHSQQGPFFQGHGIAAGAGPGGPSSGPAGAASAVSLPGWNHGDWIVENLWNDLPPSWFLYEDMSLSENVG